MEAVNFPDEFSISIDSASGKLGSLDSRLTYENKTRESQILVVRNSVRLSLFVAKRCVVL